MGVLPTPTFCIYKCANSTLSLERQREYPTNVHRQIPIDAGRSWVDQTANRVCLQVDKDLIFSRLGILNGLG